MMMKFKPFFFAAVAGIAFVSAQAEPARHASASVIHGYSAVESGPDADFVSTLTREEVRAELLQAQREGLLPQGEAGVERALSAGLRSTLSRAQVRAEAVEARRLGLLDGNGESEPRAVSAQEAESIRQAGLQAIGAAAVLTSRR